ncbi:MAG TPA: group I intron-associated PD-(D/E)XK endonuclease [Patescibacteria group bacterium]|nr:group I intron-associated PD-(D/E)XK endonuclease [Patescibacteria group bacterium]
MDRKTKGRLAEAKVIAYLIEHGYEVYLPFSNNSKYDVLAQKDSEIKRISIKYTSTKQNTATWKVEMRQIYRGKDMIKIDKFDKTQFDLIAVYIGPKEKVILVDASKSTKLALYTRD